MALDPAFVDRLNKMTPLEGFLQHLDDSLSSASTISQSAMDAATAASALASAVQGGTTKVVKGFYDFANQGGAIGSIALLNSQGQPLVLPQGALVMKVFVDVVTPVTAQALGTISLTLNTTGDALAAKLVTAIGALLDGVPNFSAASVVKTTAARTLTMNVAVGALTAGKFTCYVAYWN